MIENNNLIYVIGNDGRCNNNIDYPFGVIEYYDIRDNKWFKMNELTNLLNFSKEDCDKRCFQCIL